MKSNQKINFFILHKIYFKKMKRLNEKLKIFEIKLIMKKVVIKIIKEVSNNRTSFLNFSISITI